MAQDFSRAFYKSTQWKKQRAYILRRDGYICTEPGCYNPATEVHHIIELNPSNINDPNITLAETNLRSLCHDCHDRITRSMKQSERTNNVLEAITFDDNGYPIPVTAWH